MIIDANINKGILDSKKEINDAIVEHVVRSEIQKRINLIKTALNNKKWMQDEMKLSKGNKQKAFEEKINSLDKLVDKALDENTTEIYTELQNVITEIEDKNRK